MSRTSFAFEKKRLYFLIPSFQPFLSALSTFRFHKLLHQGILYVTPVQYLCVPFKVMFTVGLCCFLFANMITLVLFTLSDNLLTLNHISNFSSSLLTVHAISTIYLVE
ncbi:hypothetical protein NP493_1083g00011 [Ridgeia piscesae]|uniref:Uncharacterized protein n=1 Tax=Ridgeia piscesae TaxID=27915 RepID=A0AAD9NK61_RIDPI|nr:hypothetical protein NP493_1083g00011 [Ridgeia piscesae]